MAVYGSIMGCMSGICNGIIAGINTAAKTSGMDLKLVNTILGYGVESACYLLMGIMFLFMNVEKFTKEDQIKILEDQKAACLARGEEWIDPQTRMEMEEKETARQIEEARISELKEKCAKKGWNFEEKEAEYQAQKAKAEEKKAAKKKGK